MDNAEKSAPGASAPAPITLPLVPIEGSSNIAAAGYSAAVKLLDIKFLSGQTHRYADVSPEVFDEFLAAESKGKFFGSRIRGKYESQRIDTPAPTEAPAAAPTTRNPQSAWPFPTRSR